MKEAVRTDGWPRPAAPIAIAVRTMVTKLAFAIRLNENGVTAGDRGRIPFAHAQVYRCDRYAGAQRIYRNQSQDRMSVVWGTCVAVRVVSGGRRLIKKNKTHLKN